MKLKDVIEMEGKARYGCGVANLLDKLPPADQVDLVECLADRRYSAPQISRGLKAEGHDVSDGTIKRHRNRECNCAQ